MAHKQEYYKKAKAKQSSKSDSTDEDDESEESTMSKTSLKFCGGLVLVIFLVGFLASVMQQR
jgi:hypothetical protein